MRAFSDGRQRGQPQGQRQQGHQRQARRAAGRRSSSPFRRASSTKARTRSRCSRRRPALEVAWMQIGGSAPVADDGATSSTTPAPRALVIPKDGSMSWYVAMPDKAKLDRRSRRRRVHDRRLATAEDGATAEGKLVGIGSRGRSRRARRQGRAPRSRRHRLPEARAVERRARACPASRAAGQARRRRRSTSCSSSWTRCAPIASARSTRRRAPRRRTGTSSPSRRRCSSTTTCRATSRRSRTRRCGRRTTSRSTRRSRCTTSSPTSG